MLKFNLMILNSVKILYYIIFCHLSFLNQNYKKQ